MSTTFHRSTHLPASNLLGQRVINSMGEQLGTIRDFMIDFSSGNVVYVVLEFDNAESTAGSSSQEPAQKLFAVPLLAMQFDLTRGCLLFNQPREHLKEAPGFDEDEWPDFSDPALSRSLHAFYSVPPYWS